MGQGASSGENGMIDPVKTIGTDEIATRLKDVQLLRMEDRSQHSLEEHGYDAFIKGQFFTGGDLYVNEGKTAYKALAMPSYSTWQNIKALLGSSMKKSVDKSKEKGFSGDLSGDTGQVGGMFLIDKGGKTLFAHFQTADTWDPDSAEILQAAGIAVPEGFELYPQYKPPGGR